MAFDMLHWDTLIEERVARAVQIGLNVASVRKQLARARLVFGDDIYDVPDLVVRNLCNHAPWTYQWFDWLLDSLRALEGASGYDSLVGRLRRGDSFIEAYSVLQVAERLRAAGLTVDIDVPVKIGPVIKRPDIHVTDPETTTTFFVELSDLFLSERQVARAESVNRLVSALMPVPTSIVFSGQVFGDLSIADATAAAERIKSACREVECGQGYRELDIPDIAQFIVGHRAFGASVMVWSSSRGLPFNGVAGSNLQVDRGIRFEGKVARKAKQLPPDSPNILVIGSTELLRSGREPHELVDLARRAAAPHPQIAVIIVTSEENASSTPSAIDIGTDRLLRSYRIGMTQHFLIVLNSSCPWQMPAPTFDKLLDGFAL